MRQQIFDFIRRCELGDDFQIFDANRRGDFLLLGIDDPLERQPSPLIIAGDPFETSAERKKRLLIERVLHVIDEDGGPPFSKADVEKALKLLDIDPGVVTFEDVQRMAK